MLAAKFACRGAVLLISLVLLSPTLRAQAGPGPMAPRAPNGSAQVPQVPTGSPPIKTNTRLITVYIVATDSHGNVVRGLAERDFQVYDGEGGRQDIAHFEFVDAQVPQTSGPSARAPSGVSSGAEGRQIAPTVFLMDALNTETKQQMGIRRAMLLVLEKLPPETPVAVFLLTHGLHVVQSFTTDRGMLRAALQRVVSPTTNEKYPQYDPESTSNTDLDAGVTPTPELEDSEKREYEASIRERAEETAKGMSAIPTHLRGFPGRKNLIWFSEAFPIWIEPKSDFGSDPFSGTGTYESEVQAAAASLIDAGVAVYPADARGIQPDQVYSATQHPAPTELGPAGVSGALQKEDELRQNSQATLQRMAFDTGGRACENTNDMAGCVMKALNQDASYYEISYYPTNVRWDNRFHKITLQISRHGVQLAYRRGYIATTY